MSDHDAPWRPPGQTDPTPNPGLLPPPPVAAPVAGEPEVVVDLSEPAGKARPSRVVVAVASLAAVALLVVALVLVTRAGSEQAGASSPEDAAAALFAAIENEDLVTLAELLHPGERRTLAQPAFEIVDELVRLEVLDASIDLASLNGIDIVIEGLEYRLDAVAGADDLREIIVERGTIRSSANGAELPIGPTLRERFGDEIDELDTTETNEIDQAATAGYGPILVEHDGRWYFSIWYSVAEAARRDFGDDAVPALSELPAAIGADSPEAAIDALIDVASDLDLARIIGMLDPVEGAALYRYAPLFLDDAQRELDDVLAGLDASDVHWNIGQIDYTTRTDGDVAYVTVNSFTVNVQTEWFTLDLTYAPTAVSVDVTADGAVYQVDVTIGDDSVAVNGVLDGDPLRAEVTFAADSVSGWGEFQGSRVDGSLTIDPDGVCSPFEISFDGEVESGCLEDMAPGASGMAAYSLSQFDDLRLPTPTLVATRTDGVWYFSPLLTLSEAVLSYLRSTDAETVAMQIDQFEQLMSSGF
ncbi:MAG TPA: hypothetical protein VNQ73_10000 [Ilumatobacter sp.]|nr:hypothetical protein [Ilumatobacter sp.]